MPKLLSLIERAASTIAVVSVFTASALLAAPAASFPPSDPLAVYQWGMDNVKAHEVWASTTGAGVSVAVVDSGVDLQHPDLQCPGKLVVTASSDVVVDGDGSTRSEPSRATSRRSSSTSTPTTSPMYMNGFQCAARATGGLVAWTEVSGCYVDVMDDRVEASPVRSQGNASAAVVPVPGFGLGLYSPCWKVTVAFMGGRTSTVSGCGTQHALAVDADGIGAAGIYATGFTCTARAHGQQALETSIEECWTIDDSARRRDAAPVVVPGSAAATAGAFTWLGGGLREVCWRASAEFVGGARLQTTGCGWDWTAG